ncbi:MAG: substrate-binding domain-containing protein [Caldimonas sp.]
MGRSTIRDVAAEARVSLGTASRVANQRTGVNLEMKRRVERAIKKLSYTPDASAQSMRLKSTRTIGILIRDFSSPAFVSFANVVQSMLFQAGYVPLLAGYDDRPERELEILHAFAQRRIDGLIVTTSNDSNAKLARARVELGIPTILFDRDPNEAQDVIAIEHCEGVKQAMRYLFGMGHRRIALVTGQRSVRPGRERIHGFEEAYAEAGLTSDPNMICDSNFSADYAFTQTTALLRSKKRPTAIIVGGVSMLPGALRAIRSIGLLVPADISIIGATDPELSELMTPRITELRVDYPAMGRAASALILGRLQGTVEGTPRVLRFETSLLERESCAPPAARRRAA